MSPGTAELHADSTAPLVGVLPLIIQNSNLTSAVKAVCLLLCTSQQTAEAVKQSCIGKLHLRVRKPAEMSWFGQNWPLVHSLDARDWVQVSSPTMSKAFEDVLAAAATRCKAAVAGTACAAHLDCKPSQLRSLKAGMLPPAALHHLQHFTTLTSLSTRHLGYYDEVDSSTMAEGPCEALGRLTSLRRLDLQGDLIGNWLLPGTSSLTNLTSLSLSHLLPNQGVPQLRHLPARLQELRMCMEHDDFKFSLASPPIDLSHVTGLTRLVALGQGHAAGGWALDYAAIQERDKLPPNCRHLSLLNVLSAQPLLQLQQLERLEVLACSEEGLQALQQLSSLSSLSDLQVDVESELLDTDALQRLPSLKGLRLLHTCGRYDREWPFVVKPNVLNTLMQLSALQRLSLRKLEVPSLSSSGRGFADVLRGMSRLQSLWFAECAVREKSRVSSGDDSDGSTPIRKSSNEPFTGVVRAIASLPELRDLRLANLPQWGQAATAALLAATQLTGLLFVGRLSYVPPGTRMFAVYSSEFDSLVEQVHNLCGLRSLWMHSPHMTWFDDDAAGSHLTQLTELCLPTSDSHLPMLYPQSLRSKFPRAAFGHVDFPHSAIDPCDKAQWQVQWWSDAVDCWESRI